MRRRTMAVGLIVTLAAVTTARAQVAPNTPAGFAAETLMQFEASMQKFVALAEAMPADKFGWSPGPGTMTVAKVYAHVARYNYLYPATSLGAPAPDGRDADAAEDLSDKAQLVARLRESAVHVRTVVRGLADAGAATEQYGRKVPQWSVLLQLVAHMNEHLGQSIAYARMNGIVPPWSR
ncbi:MAG: DinB family protein [Gemmatimonadetes bacterium]|nr:DinB family protein [Gemmatimonadota bacterium]